MQNNQLVRKFVLKTTSTKNGGFRKYQSLPPQGIFQHAYMVLGSEMDVKIKRKQTLFNRETDWMFVPVYLTTNKGLLFVYITNDSGYVLRISSALKLNFEGTKKAKKRQLAIGSNFTYYATIVLQFHFGELHLRFDDDCENLRPWRAILLAAHQSQNGTLKMFGSPSLESVVSTKSVYPEAGDKDKTERVEIHRHPMIADVTAVTESVAEEKEGSTSVSSTTITSSSIHSSVHSKSAAKSPKSYDLTNESTATSPKYNTSAWCHDSQNQYESDNIMDDEHTSESKNSENVEAKLNESLLDQDVNVLLKHPSSSDFKSSKSHLSSEVDVSFKDLEPLSDTSYTAAFKTSPTQISDDRCSRLSTVSTSSYFNENPDVNMFYSPQIPIEHKPEKVVEKIKKQFEPLKMAAEEEGEYLPKTNALKSKYDEVIPKPSPLKVPLSPIRIFESVGEESQEEIDDYIYGEFDEMVAEEEGGYLPRLLSPISEHYSAESGTGSSSLCSISQLSVHTAIEREYADVEEEDSRGESGSPTSFREYWRDAGELAERYTLTSRYGKKVLQGANPDGSVPEEVDDGNGEKKPMSMMERVLIEVNKKFPHKSEIEDSIAESNSTESLIMQPCFVTGRPSWEAHQTVSLQSVSDYLPDAESYQVILPARSSIQSGFEMDEISDATVNNDFFEVPYNPRITDFDKLSGHIRRRDSDSSDKSRLRF